MEDNTEEIKNKEKEIDELGKNKEKYSNMKKKLELILEDLKKAKKTLASAKEAFNRNIDAKTKKKQMQKIQDIIDKNNYNIKNIENKYIPEISREVNSANKKISDKKTELEESKK